VLAAVTWAYGNHFDNGFHFDDANVILDNPHIRDLKNIPKFFADPTMFSTLPDHHIYRPITLTTIAIDYWLAGGFKPYHYQLSTFLWFLFQVALIFLLFRRLMDMADPHPTNTFAALAAAALYGLHPAGAETVNYINQRADLFCTLGTVASVLWFAARPQDRRFGLYLLPAILAFFAKPPVLIFPFVLLYVFLFEHDGKLTLAGWRGEKDKAITSLREALPALIAMILSMVVAWKMTPATFSPGGASASMYRLTQPWVALHYFKSFFLPTELSADADWGYVTSVFSTEAVAGYAFVIGLIALAMYASRRREMRPISFGIAWFFLALTPTSLVPLAEVTNDHRMFFPFVGLTLAVAWAARLALFHKTANLTMRPELRSGALAVLVLVLAAAALGTRERNEVWRTDTTLWKDVTEKSPRNGRGLMNYGLTFMERGEYPAALSYFERAMPFVPNYWTLETNLGVVCGEMRRDQEAERHFQRSISLAPTLADPRFFYARWLDKVGRTQEAVNTLREALKLNPYSIPARDLLGKIQARGFPVG
jgi:tetratricopeptide (TPR) repeat protein